MLQKIIISIGFILFTSQFYAYGQLTWSPVNYFGGLHDQEAHDIETDSLGNIYVVGWFIEQAQLDTAVYYADNSTDYHGNYIAKYNSTGQLLWSDHINYISSYGYNLSIELDNELNVYIGGGQWRYSYLSCYDSDGQHLWFKENDNYTGGWHDWKFKSLVVDDNSIWFSYHDRTVRYDLAGNYKAFIGERYDCIASASNDKLILAKDYKIYVLDTLCTITDSITSLPGKLQVSDLIQEDSSIFITGFYGNYGDDHDSYSAKISLDGEIQWVSRSNNLHAYSGSNGKGLCSDNNGTIYVTGQVDHSVDFSTGSIGQLGMGGIYLKALNAETGEIKDLYYAYSDGKFDVWGISIKNNKLPIICGAIHQTFTIFPTFGDQVITDQVQCESFFVSLTEPEVNATITGNLSYSGNQPHAKIDVLQVDSCQKVSSYKRVLTNSDGDFTIQLSNKGNYILRAFVYQQVTTYYNTTFAWQLADQIFIQSDTTINNINFEMITCDPLTGVDSITGTLLSDNGILKSYFSVILVDVEKFEVIAATRSDSLGYYYFSEVPKGTFKILVDSAGIQMDAYHTVVNTNKSNLSSPRTYHNRDYLIGSDNIIYKIDDNIENNNDAMTLEKNTEEAIYAYPNPCKNILNMNSNQPIERVSLYHTTGQLISSMSVDNNQVFLPNIASGSYLVRMQTKDTQVIQRILVE